MRPSLTAAALAALVFFGVVSATSARSTHVGACANGVMRTTIGGKPALRFCGPARATVRLGPRRIAFSGGRCIAAGGRFTVNLGAQVLALGGPKPNYFGITTASTRPGPQAGTVALNANGRGYVVTGPQVNLAAGLHRGTFHGTAGGLPLSGSFTC